MSEFKKRLSITFEKIMSNFFYFMIFYGTMSFIIVFIITKFEIVGIIILLLSIAFIFSSIIYAIFNLLKFLYWLFIEPFIKK